MGLEGDDIGFAVGYLDDFFAVGGASGGIEIEAVEGWRGLEETLGIVLVNLDVWEAEVGEVVTGEGDEWGLSFNVVCFGELRSDEGGIYAESTGEVGEGMAGEEGGFVAGGGFGGGLLEGEAVGIEEVVVWVPGGDFVLYDLSGGNLGESGGEMEVGVEGRFVMEGEVLWVVGEVVADELAGGWVEGGLRVHVTGLEGDVEGLEEDARSVDGVLEEEGGHAGEFVVGFGGIEAHGVVLRAAGFDFGVSAEVVGEAKGHIGAL